MNTLWKTDRPCGGLCKYLLYWFDSIVTCSSSSDIKECSSYPKWALAIFYNNSVNLEWIYAGHVDIFDTTY